MATAIRLLEDDAIAALRDLRFQMLRGSTVLVTGASGFVGSHLLSCFLQMQRQFQGDLSIHAAVQQVPPWLSSMGSPGRVTFHKGNLTELGFLSSLPAADVIIHAATYGQPQLFAAAQETTLRLNTIATFFLLDKLRVGGKFMFLSSSEVYSGLTDFPFREVQIGTTNTTHPRACYIEGKRCGEAICSAYRSKGVDAKAVRLCHAYGPGTRCGDRRALNSFIDMGLRDNRITLLDAGLARRSYGYISDVGAMLWRILLMGREAVYNVGGDYQTTIATLARKLGSMMQVEVSIPEDHGSNLSGAPDEVRVCIQTFETEFGTVKFTAPDLGLGRTIAWQTAIREIEKKEAMQVMAS